MPNIGDVAICGRGNTGLITSFRTRSSQFVYYGVTLLPAEAVGLPWQAVAPEVIGHITQFIPEPRVREVPIVQP